MGDSVGAAVSAVADAAGTADGDVAGAEPQPARSRAIRTAAASTTLMACPAGIEAVRAAGRPCTLIGASSVVGGRDFDDRTIDRCIRLSMSNVTA